VAPEINNSPSETNKSDNKLNDVKETASDNDKSDDIKEIIEGTVEDSTENEKKTTEELKNDLEK
jgi:hypothetical protein